MANSKLSVVLATYNEEVNLERCLKSVANIADEIVLVDGGSTDKTVSIAKTFGAKIIKTSNKPIFHINKQMAIDAATGHLVLQLDADEVVDEELRKFIETQKRQSVWSEKGWWIKRKNWFIWRWLTKGGQYPDPVIRLFVRGFGHLPQQSVHEQIEIDGTVGWAKGHLLHYSNPDLKTYLRKFDAYTSLTANEIYSKSKEPKLLDFFQYFLIKPSLTFFSLYLRHKGIVDGMAGFIFALLSALHHPVAYLKYVEKFYQNDQT